MRHQLYRIRDEHHRLLYIGISFDLARRLGQHAGLKPWWSEVARIDVEHHPDRATALLAERAAIEAEAPLHNVVHQPEPEQAGYPAEGDPAPYGLFAGAVVQLVLVRRDGRTATGEVVALDLRGPRLVAADGTRWRLDWPSIRACWWPDGRVTERSARGGRRLSVGHRVTEGDR